MNINIYYGGRGMIDDPTLYAIEKIEAVFRELNVKYKKYNLFEEKLSITTLPATIDDADGIILATTVEWFGIGGYMQMFLDACWLYGNKEKIAKTYMMPIVMSTTYGEREGLMNLTEGWSVLGGLPINGICGYITETKIFEQNSDYVDLIEKKAEDLYRAINQKPVVLPTSNQAVKQSVSFTKTAALTPQESKQLSEYVSDDKYVETQKHDIKTLTDLFKSKMDNTPKMDDPKAIMDKFGRKFRPKAGAKGIYAIVISDRDEDNTILLDAGTEECKCSLGDANNAGIVVTMSSKNLDDIINGRMTFQRGFMGGNIKMKGDFAMLRNMDQIFPFMDDK